MIALAIVAFGLWVVAVIYYIVQVPAPKRKAAPRNQAGFYSLYERKR